MKPISTLPPETGAMVVSRSDVRNSSRRAAKAVFIGTAPGTMFLTMIFYPGNPDKSSEIYPVFPDKYKKGKRGKIYAVLTARFPV